jgi:hypothetical protein
MKSNPQNEQSTKPSGTDPAGYLAGAVKRMPWLKYADAALAVCAIGAIIKSGFRLNPLQAFLWALLFLGLMFILVEFRKYAEGKRPSGVATFLVWGFAIIAVMAVIPLLGCNFWPRFCQPSSPTASKQVDNQIEAPTSLECSSNGNFDYVYCPVYKAEYSSGARVEITGAVDEILPVCDPEWREASIYLYCNGQNSDHKDYVIPRSSGLGVQRWQPPRAEDGTNFSFKCPALPFQATAVEIRVHPRGCSKARITNMKVHSTFE